MEKQAEAGASSYAHRRLSQVKILTRLVEYELEGGKGNDVTMDRDLVASILDTLEIYVEDMDGQSGGGRQKGRRSEKPAVARLN